MYCFLCDRPARYRIPVIPVIHPWRTEEDAKEMPMPLDVCVDCKRRVRAVEYDCSTHEHTVHMRSLT